MSPRMIIGWPPSASTVELDCGPNANKSRSHTWHPAGAVPGCHCSCRLCCRHPAGAVSFRSSHDRTNRTPLSSTASWRRGIFASATGFSFAGLGGRRPRRAASVVTAASSASISTSSNRFSAPARSSGKKWRCCEAGCSVRPCPLEQPKARPPSGSTG